MTQLGYLVAAYALTGVAIGGYLLSLARRQRALERGLGRAPQQPQGRPAGRAGEGVSHG